jgi:hypothetical protein
VSLNWHLCSGSAGGTMLVPCEQSIYRPAALTPAEPPWLPGLDTETDCLGTITHTSWGRGPHPAQYDDPAAVTSDLIYRHRAWATSTGQRNCTGAASMASAVDAWKAAERQRDGEAWRNRHARRQPVLWGSLGARAGAGLRP